VPRRRRRQDRALAAAGRLLINSESPHPFASRPEPDSWASASQPPVAEGTGLGRDRTRRDPLRWGRTRPGPGGPGAGPGRRQARQSYRIEAGQDPARAPGGPGVGPGRRPVRHSYRTPESFVPHNDTETRTNFPGCRPCCGTVSPLAKGSDQGRLRRRRLGELTACAPWGLTRKLTAREPRGSDPGN